MVRAKEKALYFKFTHYLPSLLYPKVLFLSKNQTSPNHSQSPQIELKRPDELVLVKELLSLLYGHVTLLRRDGAGACGQNRFHCALHSRHQSQDLIVRGVPWNCATHGPNEDMSVLAKTHPDCSEKNRNSTCFATALSLGRRSTILTSVPSAQSWESSPKLIPSPVNFYSYEYLF